MKILWLSNFALPVFAEALGMKRNYSEGWLAGLSKRLVMDPEIELVVVFPQDISTEFVTGCTGGIKYCGYPAPESNVKYNIDLKWYFAVLLQRVNPDIINIMGSEYPHCYSMVEACIDCGLISRAIISIQGLVSVIARHYDLGLSKEILYRKTLRDILKRDTLLGELKQLEKRGEYEILALKNIRNVIGRTDWDRACTFQINPKVNYYFNNETLRPAFYTGTWSDPECEPYSIFVSQGGNVIKGLHFVLKAMPIILRQYPKTQLYIAGSDVLLKKQNYPKWRRKAYENMIFDIINEHNLGGRIVFCGRLDETQMRERYLKSNVFISASSIENSPNSIGEAMLLGVPVVASDVGGVKNLLTHQKEGFIYQADAYYMLAYYVCSIFGNKDMAKMISVNAKGHAKVTHNPDINTAKLISIYKTIAESTGQKAEVTNS